jgi:hypothetical protein
MDFSLVLRPEGKAVVTSKLIHKIKHVVDCIIEMYKALFLVKGFSQQEGEDYDEPLALVRAAIRYMRRSLMYVG